MSVLGWFRGPKGEPPARQGGWAVVDIETTGLYPRTDRIVEIAVVRLDSAGREIDAWTTLVDPERDIGASQIHGLRSRDLMGAPTFSAIAPTVLANLAGDVFVAHNVRFDAGFLYEEAIRAGLDWGPIDGVDTMTIPYSLGLVSGRRLDVCCEQLGIVLERHHTALDDARAAAGILRRLLPPAGYLVPPVAPFWLGPMLACAVRLRTDAPMPRATSTLAGLAGRVRIPEGVDVAPDAALAYFDVLDRVLEDRRITPDEVLALNELADDWGISGSAIDQLHAGYMGAVWDLALADGVVTPAERDDLEIVADLLGVPVDAGMEPSQAAVLAQRVMKPVQRPGRPSLSIPTAPAGFAGKSVCFTGDSACTILGVPLGRADQERFAAAAGMIVKSGVSSRLDLLVLGDPDSQSGKARRAAELGVRRMAEAVFWRALGVTID